MSEIHFIVEEAPEGGYLTCAVDVDIVTEAKADNMPGLHAQVRNAVHCHFDADKTQPDPVAYHA